MAIDTKNYVPNHTPGVWAVTFPLSGEVTVQVSAASEEEAKAAAQAKLDKAVIRELKPIEPAPVPVPEEPTDGL